MPSQQQIAEQIFGAALELPLRERPVFLDQACSGAPELRRLVDQLLLEDELAGSFMDRPIANGLKICEPTEPSTPMSPEALKLGRMAAPRFEPGQAIADRFVVVRFIARGGMGEVYEVEDRLLQGTRVALKIILPEIASDADASHRFEQEVLVARKTTHPNLCPIYEIFHCDEPQPSFLFLTMKLLEGETLDARLRRGIPIPRGEKIEIFHQMILGISAIHSSGVIHRDIKPNNVMLHGSGPVLQVTIMDFGLARVYSSEATLHKPGFVAGTPGYLAPELLTGQRPSQATDIFALGVVLHRVLTGERPVTTPDGSRTHEASSLATADVPLNYIETVREFLSEDAHRRQNAFDQMRSMLGSNPGQYALPAPPRPLWTRRTFAFASAAAVCAVAGGAAWNRETIYDHLYPLPQKRFVAILGWPPPFDARTKPILLGLIDAMADELAHAEVFDHNFFVAGQRTATDMSNPVQLNETRESLGANLVLATSVAPLAKGIQVLLQVLSPASTRPIRAREVVVPVNRQFSLPEKVVRAAADLLDLHNYQPESNRFKAATDNPEALAAFQSAEALMKIPNYVKIEDAIAKYKQAVEIDRHYAFAHAKLSLAYLRLYAMRRDPSSVLLARANADTALTLNTALAEAHVALASVYQETGHLDDAVHEFGKALSLDPADTRTMTYQGQLLSILDRWQEATDTFKSVIRARPNYWLAYHELGANYSMQGNYPEALEALRAASALVPNDSMVLSNVGAVHFFLGNLEASMAALKKSMAISADGNTAATLADVMRAQGKARETLQYSMQAVELSPDDSTSWLELGDAYAMDRRHAKNAVKAYARAAQIQEEQLETDPSNGPGWMLLALYRLKSGNPAAVNDLISRADSLASKDIPSQLIKVRILELLGRHTDAAALLAECRRRGATRWQIAAIPDLEKLLNEGQTKAS